MGKRSIKMQDGPTDLNATEHRKSTDNIFRFQTATNLKKHYHLLSFSIVSKKNIHLSENNVKYSSLFQLHICETLDFSTQIMYVKRLNAEADKRIQLSFCYTGH